MISQHRTSDCYYQWPILVTSPRYVVRWPGCPEITWDHHLQLVYHPQVCSQPHMSDDQRGIHPHFESKSDENHNDHRYTGQGSQSTCGLGWRSSGHARTGWRRCRKSLTTYLWSSAACGSLLLRWPLLKKLKMGTNTSQQVSIELFVQKCYTIIQGRAP